MSEPRSFPENNFFNALKATRGRLVGFKLDLPLLIDDTKISAEALDFLEAGEEVPAVIKDGGFELDEFLVGGGDGKGDAGVDHADGDEMGGNYRVELPVVLTKGKLIGHSEQDRAKRALGKIGELKRVPAK